MEILINQDGVCDKLVRHDDSGKRGVIVKPVGPDQCYGIVECDTGKYVRWHFQDLTWLYLLPQSEW